MAVRFQSEIDEILQKHDLVALGEMLKVWFTSAVVQVMTELAMDDQSRQGHHSPARTSLPQDVTVHLVFLAQSRPSNYG